MTEHLVSYKLKIVFGKIHTEKKKMRRTLPYGLKKVISQMRILSQTSIKIVKAKTIL